MFMNVRHIGQISFFLPVQRVGVTCGSRAFRALINHRTRSEGGIAGISVIMVIDTELESSDPVPSSDGKSKRHYQISVYDIAWHTSVRAIPRDYLPLRAESLFSAVRIRLVVEDRARIDNVGLRIFAIQLDRQERQLFDHGTQRTLSVRIVRGSITPSVIDQQIDGSRQPVSRFIVIRQFRIDTFKRRSSAKHPC